MPRNATALRHMTRRAGAPGLGCSVLRERLCLLVPALDGQVRRRRGAERVGRRHDALAEGRRVELEHVGEADDPGLREDALLLRDRSRRG